VSNFEQPWRLTPRHSFDARLGRHDGIPPRSAASADVFTS
jgi:hypothetical protein